MAIINSVEAAKRKGFSRSHMAKLLREAPKGIKDKINKLPNGWVFDDSILKDPYFNHKKPGKKGKQEGK